MSNQSTKVWASIADVKEANRQAGNHWFDADTMKFFKTKITTDIIYDRYFISSETNPCNETRYSARLVNDDGTISTIGTFHDFKSKQRAHDFIYGYVNGNEV